MHRSSWLARSAFASSLSWSSIDVTKPSVKDGRRQILSFLRSIVEIVLSTSVAIGLVNGHAKCA